MIKTILVATDHSEHARKAVALAGELAGKYEARLVLMHVIKPRRQASRAMKLAEAEHLIDTTVDESVDHNDEAQAALGNHILERARARVSEPGLEVITRLERGAPARRILEGIRKEKADMVILGSRGLSGLKGLLMGSVSHKVSQLSPCTCVVVK